MMMMMCKRLAQVPMLCVPIYNIKLAMMQKTPVFTTFSAHTKMAADKRGQIEVFARTTTIATTTTLHYATLHYSNYTALQLQLQLQLHYIALCYTTLIARGYATTTTTATTRTTLHYTTLHLQLHHATIATQLCYTTLHRAIVGEVTTANTVRKHNFDHLSVHQWIRSAIHVSQQLTSPIAFYLWNFCHCLVRYYWCKMHDISRVPEHVHVAACMEGWTLVVSQLQGAPALAELHRRLFAATGLPFLGTHIGGLVAPVRLG